MIPERDQRTIKAEFDVWLARDMLFNDPPGQNIRRYPRFKRARKIRYTRAILARLDRVEAMGFEDKGCRAVAIKLGKTIRYVWRKDLLSRKEYDEIQKEQRSRLRVLREKPRGSVDKERAN